MSNGHYKASVAPKQFPVNKNIQGSQMVITDLDGSDYKSLVIRFPTKRLDFSQ